MGLWEFIGYKLTGPGLGQSQARPSPTFGFWPGLWFCQARAASSQGFQAKPGTSLDIIENNAESTWSKNIFYSNFQASIIVFLQ